MAYNKRIKEYELNIKESIEARDSLKKKLDSLSLIIMQRTAVLEELKYLASLLPSDESEEE